MQTSMLLSSALLATLFTGGTAMPTDEVLRDSDHKKIAKQVTLYWQAKSDVKGIQKAFDKLISTVEGVQDKMKGDTDLLACVEDWEKIFWMATEDSLDKPKTGRVTEDDDGTPEFTYHVSRSYKSNKGPFPLFLIFADEGQSAKDALAEWDDEGLRAEGILVAAELKLDADGWTSGEGVGAVMSTYGRVARSNKFGFDFNRVFLAGKGKGFSAAATTARSYPHLFAGLVGRGEVADTDPRNFLNLPTFLPSGVGGAESIKGKVDDLGYGNCTLGEDNSTAVWTWAQDLERDSYPQQIIFWPPQASTRGTHWMNIDGINLDGSPRVDARVDREANSITIDADDISSVRIYFNDALVDLSKPVKVIVNGTMHEEVGPRNRQLMIDGTYDQGDWGRVFTKIESYDVPDKSTE